MPRRAIYKYPKCDSRNIRNKILQTATGNVTEWCKADKSRHSGCWEKIQKMKIDFDVDVEEFTQNDHLAAAAPKVAVDWSIYENPQIWINAADWIEKTELLPEKDASFCRSIWKLLENRRNPSVKQMPIAFKIMESVVSKGFEV